MTLKFTKSTITFVNKETHEFRELTLFEKVTKAQAKHYVENDNEKVLDIITKKCTVEIDLLDLTEECKKKLESAQ
ncbi:MAG: hypothetical protein PUD34_06005 [bacterium]|nr:hypothetical protein [bacterium]